MHTFQGRDKTEISKFIAQKEASSRIVKKSSRKYTKVFGKNIFGARAFVC
jgi:hypothetical protein